MAEIYYSGQGSVFVSTRDANGAVTAFRNLGNIPALKITLETDVLEHKESSTGQRLTDFRLTREQKASISMTLENFSKENLQMLMYGSTVANTGPSSIADEVFSVSDLGPASTYALAHPLVKSTPPPVLTGNSGSPELVLGVDYKIDYAAGIVTMINVPVTQPYKIDYSWYGVKNVPMFKDTYKERFLRFTGLNTANSDKPVIIELYRVVFDPVSNFDVITDELAQFELEGSVLYDSGRDTGASNSQLGGFGRVIQAP